LGSIVSDQLEDGRVLSGVGGQYNFVAQAHELENARSIILLRATRLGERGVQSNIVWQYGHATVPRHLRDVVVTEYGVADLRAKTDSEVIAALLNITDSRFQPALLEQAKTVGKISADYQIPPAFRHNTPEKLQTVYDQYPALFPRFPLGSDFTEVEQDLLEALNWLKIHTRGFGLFQVVANMAGDASRFRLHLERMQLEQTDSLKQKVYRLLLVAALRATAA
jgi:hypothetical protein